MIEFITKAELLKQLRISDRTYHEANNPNHPHYIPDFPQPVKLFTGNKHRFSSIDVEAFIKKYSHTASNDVPPNSSAA